MMTSMKSKSKVELKGLEDTKIDTEVELMASPQCSTARDLLLNEHGMDANTFIGYELRSRKKEQQTLLKSTQSNLTKQGSELNRLTRDDHSDKR